MYNTVHKLTPVYSPIETLNYNLRDAENKLQYLPKPRNDYLHRSFSYSGTFLRNNLPQNIRTSNSLRNFKRGIDTLYSLSDSHTANM